VTRKFRQSCDLIIDLPKRIHAVFSSLCYSIREHFTGQPVRYALEPLAKLPCDVKVGHRIKRV
jgi:hypothetical protein